MNDKPMPEPGETSTTREDRKFTADYLANMTDADLVRVGAVAYDDTKRASEEQNNSEWHSQCFAALCVFAHEANRRGIKLLSANDPTAASGQINKD